MNTLIKGIKESHVRTKRLRLSDWMAMLASVCLLLCVGCGYPEVSPKAYEITKALYSVCNLKRQDDLEKVTDLISKSELSESESEWLLAIVEQARSGEWGAAQEEVRTILEDQVDL